MDERSNRKKTETIRDLYDVIDPHEGDAAYFRNVFSVYTKIFTQNPNKLLPTIAIMVMFVNRIPCPKNRDQSRIFYLGAGFKGICYTNQIKGDG